DRHRSFRAWLKTITLNKWRDGRRRAAHLPLEAGGEPVAPPAASSEAKIFAEEEYRRHVLARAMELMQTDFQPTTWRAFWERRVRARTSLSASCAACCRRGT